MKHLQLPLTQDTINSLKAGECYFLSGKLYTARDAAHKRLVDSLNNNEPLPFDLNNQAIYYVGPTPTKPNEIIGSAGPTSSYRMDKYVLPLLQNNLKIMIGKGKRSEEINNLCRKYKAVYFQTLGGAGAKIANSISSCKIIAYPELQSEAIYEIEIKNLFIIVSIDTEGNIFGY
jgi:fumarate hydratase subunit beta